MAILGKLDGYYMRRFLGIILTALVLMALGFVWYSRHKKTPEPTPTIPAITSATILKPAKPVIQFVLQDSNGKPFSQKNLRGYWTLMFFGYADCPKICPTTLAIASGVFRSLPEQSPPPPARLVFVTLDPKTDTPEKLKTFLSRFHPAFIGLTGDETELNNLSKFMNIYSWTDPKLGPQGQKMIDHSSTLLIINPEGQLQALLTPPYQIESLKKDLQSLMNH